MEKSILSLNLKYVKYNYLDFLKYFQNQDNSILNDIIINIMLKEYSNNLMINFTDFNVI